MNRNLKELLLYVYSSYAGLLMFLSELLQPYSAPHELCNKLILTIKTTNRSRGNRCLDSAATHLWNKPPEIHQALSLSFVHHIYSVNSPVSRSQPLLTEFLPFVILFFVCSLFCPFSLLFHCATSVVLTDTGI